MKCFKCHHKNSYKANYCYYCGKKFTEKEKEKSSNSKVVKILKSLRNFYDRISLSNITGNIYFRIVSIVIVLLIGVVGILSNGIHLQIKKSNDYTYQYNKKDDEYYLYTDNDTTKLNLYTLGKNSTIKVNYYDDKNNLITETKYEDYNKITLNANSYSNNYYIITHKKDKLKLYIYKNNSLKLK